MTGKFLPSLPAAWHDALKNAPDLEPIDTFLKKESSAGKTVYPAAGNIFAALALTPPENIKVVILGQDPYHGPDQAHGLSFSVRKGMRLPPSLRNIYKEIAAEYGVPMPKDGDLTGWAKQGVLLLNATLTVEAGLAAAHAKRGWEDFTDAVIRAVSDGGEHIVFVLWGSHAQKKSALIDARRHLILEAPHPSPLSAHRGFLGCGHFRKANDYLTQHNRAPIDWTAL